MAFYLPSSSQSQCRTCFVRNCFVFFFFFHSLISIEITKKMSEEFQISSKLKLCDAEILHNIISTKWKSTDDWLNGVYIFAVDGVYCFVIVVSLNRDNNKNDAPDISRFDVFGCHSIVPKTHPIECFHGNAKEREYENENTERKMKRISWGRTNKKRNGIRTKFEIS